MPWFQDYHLVDTAEKFEGFYGRLGKQKRFAIDLETTSLSRCEAEIVGLAFTWQPGEAWYLAVRGPEGSPLLDPTTTLDRLRPIFEDPTVAKVNQNIKYDLLVLRGHGVEVHGVAGDPMVADYLLHAGERSHNLEELARRYLNHQVIPITDLIGKKGKKQPQLRMDQVPVERVAVYSGEDADVAWRLALHLEARAGRAAAAEALRRRGSAADRGAGRAGVQRHPPRRAAAEAAERRTWPGSWSRSRKRSTNWPAGRSTSARCRSCEKCLFDELKLPVQGKTGMTGAASTDQETLEKLAALDVPGSAVAAEDPGTAADRQAQGHLRRRPAGAGQPGHGRVHASFNQTVAATGRLARPAIRTCRTSRCAAEQGQQIRQAFLPAEGWRC